MEIEVVEKTKNKLIFNLHGANHTFCNNLKDELWNDKSVKVAAYNIDHPQISAPQFIIDTDGKKDIKKILKDAVDRIKKTNKEFLAAFKKA